jgi:hypothetical protein
VTLAVAIPDLPPQRRRQERRQTGWPRRRRGCKHATARSKCRSGGMADAADSKSAVRKGVRVRVPPSVPFSSTFRAALRDDPDAEHDRGVDQPPRTEGRRRARRLQPARQRCHRGRRRPPSRTPDALRGPPPRWSRPEPSTGSEGRSGPYDPNTARGAYGRGGTRPGQQSGQSAEPQPKSARHSQEAVIHSDRRRHGPKEPARPPRRRKLTPFLASTGRPSRRYRDRRPRFRDSSSCSLRARRAKIATKRGSRSIRPSTRTAP